MESETNEAPALLERQLQIIEEIARASRELSFSEIQRGIGLPKGTTHRILSGLCAVGLIEVNPSASRQYRLGRRLIKLLGLSISPDQVIPLARPVLHDLVDQFGETAFLAMLKNGQVETVTMVTPVKDWQGHVHPGRIMPPHAAASAKAICAFRDPSEWKSLLREPLPRFTEKTNTKVSAILKEYSRVREEGVAMCCEEIDHSQLAIATPIHLDRFGVQLSICQVGPVDRMKQHGIEKISSALKAASTRLSREMVRFYEQYSS